MLVELKFERVTEVFAGFGQKGVRAETVAERLWEEVQEYAASPVPVGPHLADQLLLPLALAAARHAAASQFVTLPFTEHTRTQAELLTRFLPVTIADRLLDEGQHELRVAPR
jgi:RNA 3'-terminal phosphate cyclase (ATP)